MCRDGAGSRDENEMINILMNLMRERYFSHACMRVIERLAGCGRDVPTVFWAGNNLSQE